MLIIYVRHWDRNIFADYTEEKTFTKFESQSRNVVSHSNNKDAFFPKYAVLSKTTKNIIFQIF